MFVINNETNCFPFSKWKNQKKSFTIYVEKNVLQ